MPKMSRSRAIKVGMVVLAVLALVVGPAYLTSRSGYFAQFPGLADQYKPWSTSSHLEAGCEGCHIRPDVFSRAKYRARMVGEFYLSLVSAHEPDVFGKPTNRACVACHSDLRTVSPKGDLQIPHRAHITLLKMKCIACHDYLVHEKSPEGKHTPPMAGCLRCHDGDTAKDSCTACHTEKAAPLTHRAKDWSIVHAQEAKDPRCNSCHKWTANWCADCHSRRPKSHGDDWRAVHGLRVKTHRGCEACHAAPFCVRCHGEVPALNFDPTVKLAQ